MKLGKTKKIDTKREKGNNEIDKQKEKKNMERSEIEREKKEKIMN